MQPPSQLPLESLVPVGVRFSLRGIFVAVAAIAAWLAAVAPWFREWNGDQRLAFLLVCGSTALGAISTTLFRSVLRIRAERRAGAVRFRLPHTITRFAFVFAVGTGLFALGLSTVLAFMQAIYSETRVHGVAWIWNLLAFQNGAHLARAGLGVRWKTTLLELCDDGILCGFSIQPWSNVGGFRWGDSNPHRLILQWRRWGVVTVRVNASDQPAIEQFLLSRLSAHLK